MNTKIAYQFKASGGYPFPEYQHLCDSIISWHRQLVYLLFMLDNMSWEHSGRQPPP